MYINTSRRGFLKGVAGAAAIGAFAGCATSPRRPNGKIRLAAVGIMGKGFSDWYPMVKSGKAELVAICDADAKQVPAAQAQLKKMGSTLDLSKIPFYTDYRELLDNAGRIGIDAMTISGPDHMHAPVAIPAMKMGIHVYVQKPLVRTLWELDYFNRTARDSGVCVQMGNQGSALDGLRRCAEVLQTGILGEVKEVHVWTNRPVWPQGFAAAEATKGAADKIQEGLDWNSWLSTAKMRNFKGAYKPGAKGYDPWNLCQNVYHAFSWRGFFDFGAGAFGDMACHTMNLPFRGLELGAVESAEMIEVEEWNEITYPMKSIVKMVYAARESKVRPGVKLPAVDFYWYDGDLKPSADIMPTVIAAQGKVPNTGCFIIGSKGVVCSTNDYGGQSFISLNGETKVVDMFKHEACKKIPRTIPFRSDAVAGQAQGPGAAAVSADGHYIEFLDAINGVGPVYRDTHSRCFSDVEFCIPQMEGILVGCMAQRMGKGVKLAWDSKKQKFDNEKANAFIKPYIRPGYEF